MRRLGLLHDRYGRVPEAVANLDQDEVEELTGALLELRGQLRNLQWFGEINRRGFVKISTSCAHRRRSRAITNRGDAYL